MTDKNFEEQVMDQAKKAMARPIYKFEIPDRIAKESGVNEIGLVELTANEQMMAANRARANVARLALELPMQSIVAANGKKVSTADGTVEKIWDALGPKGRELVVTAYGRLHTPEDTEVEDFLASMSVEVG